MAACMTPWHDEVNRLSCSRHDKPASPSVQRMSDQVAVPPEDKPVVERIKARRRELGLTQADLAVPISVSPTYVTKIERGQRPLQLPFIRAWAELLGVSPGWLLSGTTGDALPLAHVVDSDARLTGPVVTTTMFPGGRAFAPKVESIAVLKSAPGCFAAKVATPEPLRVGIDSLSRKVSFELHDRDILIFEPIASQALEARIVWVTKTKDISELRVWRLIDGRPWLWPFDGTSQTPVLLDGWAVRATLSEQRRTF